ncbi:hypothetical protein SEUCBS140593_001034 [Sporothrix eucalyptigena]|uniref:Stress-response A/B barrel domain-containing protein n=1 Tax=Sporothrix eucalyptigena TaxID=1812306 RepID=A0ABP0AUV4_9PEZI
MDQTVGQSAALTIAPIVTLIQLVLPHISIRGHRLSHTLLAGIVPGRSTARIPTSTGRYLAQDKNGLVVFHFGARFNHPLGVFAPGARTMTKLFRANLSALEENRSEYGLLGADLFRGGASTRASNDTILLVLYFRDVHGLQRFACSEAHQEAYRWLGVVTTAGQDGSSQKYPHLSAFHETFVVPADGYETLYINTAPILLGNTYIEKEGDDDEQVWLSSLVDADDARLRTMTARLKRSC